MLSVLGCGTSARHPLLLDPQAFAYDAVGSRTTGGWVVNPINSPRMRTLRINMTTMAIWRERRCWRRGTLLGYVRCV